MTDSSMRYHLLLPDVKCPACGAGLTFVRMRGWGDVYSCASGGHSCRCHLIHYRNKETKTCGYAVIYAYGPFGVWRACGEGPAAKG
jgi:hypothetical protein